MDKTTFTRKQIVDAAIELAESSDWEAVRLHDVAIKLGLSLDDIREEFSEKDELIDAWFDRADSAMLQDAALPVLAKLSRKERMHRAMMAWLDALAGHRRVTRQMILSKLEPGHVHIQFPGLMRVSRTVQWMREAAGYDASFPRRAVEEVTHTSIYLATFAYWMSDESPQSERTRRFLDRQLSRAGIVFTCCGGVTEPKESVPARQGPSHLSPDLEEDRPIQGIS
ncbi:MAG: TetR/AcrR family transcriptional regulator [Pseudomonadota bacterium]|nr:TetR/AcrR family transcriptional regulator [Pseudomonadota bacterium]